MLADDIVLLGKYREKVNIKLVMCRLVLEKID